MTGSNPAWRSAMTSVLPSTTAAKSALPIAVFARWSPYRTALLWKRSPSGEFTYLPRSGSSSRSLRAWNPTTRPRASASGKHEPLREVVGAARRDEPGGLQLVEREASLLRLLGQPSPRREPEPELLRDLLPQTALCEVLAHRRACRAVPEQPLEVRGRLVEHGVRAARGAGVPRRCFGEASSYSSGMRNRSASHSIAPTKSRFSVSRTNATRSPPFPQPKQ